MCWNGRGLWELVEQLGLLQHDQPYWGPVLRRCGCRVEEVRLVDIQLLEAEVGREAVDIHVDFEPAPEGGHFRRSMWHGVVVTVFIALVDHDDGYGDLVVYTRGCVPHPVHPGGIGRYYVLDAGYPHGVMRNRAQKSRYILSLVFVSPGATPEVIGQLSSDAYQKALRGKGVFEQASKKK